jgi:hypothetical protein
MSDQMPKQNPLENLWVHDQVWYRSDFFKAFLKAARSQYPIPQNGTKAAWPEDNEGIAQNLSYFFTGHSLKISKILCSLLGNEEAIHYLSQTREITVIDLACGAGMASISFLDFLHQTLKAGIIKRQSPLIVSFFLNDLNEPCVAASRKNLELIRKILVKRSHSIQIASIQDYTGSISEVVPIIRETLTAPFDLLFFCNAFDHVLMYGHKAIEKNPQCTDPIAYARPCDRPALLADFFHQLGGLANPYFSRVVLMQESRHCHLISVSLPDREIPVTYSWMTQETDRPDIETPTLNVRFAWCGCRYGFPDTGGSSALELRPLPGR